LKVLLISANTEQFNMPAMPLGLACVVEATRNAGHDVTMLDLMFEMDAAAVLKKMIAEFRPECIGISVRNIDDHGIERMGFLLLGGPGETREAVEESLAFADSLKLEALRLTAGVRIYPDTQLAKTAENEGAITSQGNLLHPRFYLAQGLEGWLSERLKEWQVSRPYVIM